MEEITWSKENVWVARDKYGQIYRVSDTSPEEMLRQAEELKKLAK
ncbi:MAG: hypothetical protein ACE3L7_04065 [Candidatus Pristimantibacillus sp.]